MSHVVSQVSFDQIAIPTPQVDARPLSSCCERAVAQALEAAETTGSTAIVAMLVMSVMTLVVGFVAGLTTAWMLSG